MSYTNIKIVIDGPGGVINYDVELIRMTLAMVGYKFEVQNECPIQDETPEQYIARIDSLKETKMAKELGLTEMPTITLIAKHQPWGG